MNVKEPKKTKNPHFHSEKCGLMDFVELLKT